MPALYLSLYFSLYCWVTYHLIKVPLLLLHTEKRCIYLLRYVVPCPLSSHLLYDDDATDTALPVHH